MTCLAEQQHPDEAAPRIQLPRCPGPGGAVLSFLTPVLPFPLKQRSSWEPPQTTLLCIADQICFSCLHAEGPLGTISPLVKEPLEP